MPPHHVRQPKRHVANRQRDPFFLAGEATYLLRRQELAFRGVVLISSVPYCVAPADDVLRWPLCGCLT